MSISTKELVALAVPYFIAVGACYLFGYWGAIGINVLEFIGFADVAKLAIYPLIAALIFLAVGIVFSEVTTGALLPLGGGEHTAVGRFGRRFARPLYALVILLMMLIYKNAPEPLKWFGIALLTMSFSIPVSNLDSVSVAIPNPKVRFFLLYFAFILPPLAFAYGRVDIYLATKFASAKTVDVSRSKLPLVSEKDFPVTYLGLLGATFVLRETKTGQLVLVKQRDDMPLFISPSSNTGRLVPANSDITR